MKTRYITAIAASMALAATATARDHSHRSGQHYVEPYCPDYADSWQADAQRERIIRLQEETNRELRRQRAAIEEGQRRAFMGDFSRAQEADRARRKAATAASRERLIEALTPR